MSAGEVTEGLVRAAIEEALGDGRLEGVGAGEPLLRSGVITSIELAGVLVHLERRFGLTLPEGVALRMSVASIVRALGGTAAETEREPGGPLVRGLKRATRRPAIFMGALVASLVLTNLGVERLVEGPLAPEYQEFVEGGERLYPFSGAFSQDSFRFAMRHHEIVAPPPARPTGEMRVGVFGDCGTMGSYVAADDAIPARMEAALRAQGTAAKVENLAWYGRLLPKDFMLLELVWDAPLDVVVFSLSDDHLRRSATLGAIERYLHVTYNRDLFERFEARIPAHERAPFRAVERRLRRADRAHLGPLHRWAYETFPLLPYRPFLQYLLTVRWLPAPFEPPMRDEMTVFGQRRVALSEPPRLPPELIPADLDREAVRMLGSVIRLLGRRGVRVLLYVEPVAPRSWRVDRALSAASLADRLAEETGCTSADLSWALDEGDFTDSLAHYTREANRRIGEALARAIRSGS